MRTAKTILTVIQERGKERKPIERVYKLLFNRELYLNAYAKLYPNKGALTKGVTEETADGMSIRKIDRMIELLREEKYRWKPVRREHIPKKNVTIQSWDRKGRNQKGTKIFDLCGENGQSNIPLMQRQERTFPI